MIVGKREVKLKMDTQKIGKFLKELRKQSNMTQEQLGEKIGVTNKTISKWENGNYMPPIEQLKTLSDIYQVSINEILSGEKLSQENYEGAAEENIILALEKIQIEEKRFENSMLILMWITSVLVIAIVLLLPKGNNLTTMDVIKEIIITVLVIIMGVISNVTNFCAVVIHKEK